MLPKEFILKDSGRKCELDMKYPKFNLWIDGMIDGTLATDLPPAPPIAKEDIPVVCQSDNYEYKGEVTTRITYNVFVEGTLSQIVAEHNRRSLSTSVEVDSKIEKHWDGMTLDQFSE